MSKINIVLFQPEIPQNTANIMRTAVATDSNLHLIKPYGFDLKEKKKIIKRSSTNYIDDVILFEHESFNSFIADKKPKNIYFLSRYGKKPYSEIDINQKDDQEIYIVFGKESSGIDLEILKKYETSLFRIPMVKEMRSLNLSNCVAICVYDLLRKDNFLNLSLIETQKKDYL